MDEEWDAENFTVKAPIVNKWEGEDEDDDVKDSWDAEEEEVEEQEEKKDSEKSEIKPKKPIAERIAEKERLRQEELAKKLQEAELEMTDEEKMKQQIESDLKMALETTFLGNDTGTGLDAMNPITKEEFAEFGELLQKKILSLAGNPEFPAFIEDHVRNICVALNAYDLKSLKMTIDNLYIEKQKIEKGDKAKKNKGKSKVKLRMEDVNARDQYSAFTDYDYDDFM